MIILLETSQPQVSQNYRLDWIIDSVELGAASFNHISNREMANNQFLNAEDGPNRQPLGAKRW
jgi:hypothetical protein|tara:strand:- start:316 stop:504 length:189 start_codon:yes stop_codon:yes gene_type:complete